MFLSQDEANTKVRKGNWNSSRSSVWESIVSSLRRKHWDSYLLARADWTESLPLLPPTGDRIATRDRHGTGFLPFLCPLVRLTATLYPIPSFMAGSELKNTRPFWTLDRSKQSCTWKGSHSRDDRASAVNNCFLWISWCLWALIDWYCTDRLYHTSFSTRMPECSSVFLTSSANRTLKAREEDMIIPQA